MHQRTSLVELGRIERDAELHRHQREPFFQGIVRRVENVYSRRHSVEINLPAQPISQFNDDVVTWTASQYVEEPTTDDGEEKSSSNTALYGGIGAIVVILAIAGYVILNRRASAAFEEESFYEEEEFIEEDDEPIEIPEGKPLDEFEDKTISDEPEIIERPGDALISEVDDSGDDVNEDVSEESEAAVEETSEEDDGISVDEHGTEWYEDEVGTWWYREEGAEDWSEYHE